MPHYDYSCTSCGSVFERFQKITDAPLKECLSCNQLTAIRVPSAGIGLSFQGKGFYITDYGAKKESNSSCLCKKGEGCES